MVFYRPSSNTRNPAFHLDRRRTCHASMELAGADAVRMAAHYLLAGSWTAGSLPNSRWRPWHSRLSSLRRPAPNKRAHGRTLGEDDARGAREVPQQLAPTLRRLRTANQRNQGAGLIARRWRLARKSHQG